MSTLTAAEKAARRDAAMEQRRLLVEWETNGQQGDRPETPDWDAIQQQYENGGSKRTRKAAGERTPRVCAAEVAVAEMAANATQPWRIIDAAKTLGLAQSSTKRGHRKCVAANVVELIKGTKFYRPVGSDWAAPAVERAERPERVRKMYLAQSKSGIVHACTRTKVDDSFIFVTACTSEGKKSPAVTKLEDQAADVTCKNCLKTVEASAA